MRNASSEPARKATTVEPVPASGVAVTVPAVEPHDSKAPFVAVATRLPEERAAL